MRMDVLPWQAYYSQELLNNSSLSKTCSQIVTEQVVAQQKYDKNLQFALQRSEYGLRRLPATQNPSQHVGLSSGAAWSAGFGNLPCCGQSGFNTRYVIVVPGIGKRQDQDEQSHRG